MFWRFFYATACMAVFLVPLPALAASSYTLEEAVTRALEANPALEAASHTVEAAQSGLRAARSDFGPSVTSSYGYTRYNPGGPLRATQERQAYSVGVGVSQPLFAGFSLLNTYQKAALQKDYQSLQQRNTQLNITAQVQRQFLNYLKAQETIRSTRRALERAVTQRDLAQAAYTVGVRPRLDVLQAELDLSRTEASLIQSENTLEICRAQLNTLLNLPVETPVEYVGDLSIIAFSRTLEECLEVAFRQRPDVLMAEKSVLIAGKDRNLALGAFLPRISASAAWNSTGDDWRAAGNQLTPKLYSQWQFGVSAGWVLFTSGKRLFVASQSRSQISALTAQKQTTLNNSALEVQSYLLGVQDARRMIAVASHSVSSAEESYKNALMRYELDLGTHLDLLTAQSGLASAELAFISAQTDYLAALANLYIAMGELHPSLKP